MSVLNEFKNINFFPQFSTFTHFVDNFYHNHPFLGYNFEHQAIKNKTEAIF
jgi:hypothetical protein